MLAMLLLVATVLVLSPAGTSAQDDSSCKACNCQFSNVDVFTDLIRRETRNSSYVPWTPVTKTRIGTSNIHTATTLSFTIPSLIPNTAQAVLVYTTVRCGISTIDRGEDIEYYVLDAYNSNSDNMWFPMPANRRVYVHVPIAFPNNCHTFVNVIGYR